MKTTKIFQIAFLLIATLVFSGCDYNEELIEELEIQREFAPIDLSAMVRNQISVELSWDSVDDVENYTVEISKSPDYSNIVETRSVSLDQLPILIPLEGETQYYIRVKAVSSRGLEDSTWAETTALTLTEQLFLPSEAGDIAATSAVLRWLPNSNVTQITLSPGDIIYDLSDEEREAGIATIEGLTGETEYTARLLNNSTIRGTFTFTTGIDVGDNTLVLPTDDLFQMIADAEPGDILLLEQGDYTSQSGSITLDKSITIQGLRTDFKPQLKVSFSIVDGATDVSLIDLDLTGDLPTELIDVVRYTAAGNYNSLLVSGCNIHDYDRSFIAGNETDAILQTLTVENCMVTNIMTNGGDFIDFRNSDVLNINLLDSTFNNCAPGRDFLRIDDAGTSTQMGLVCNILIDSCTLYACSNSDSRRILYVRFQTNEIIVRNTLITDTAVEAYSDQSRTDENIEFTNNNYFNAPTLYDSAQPRYDDSSTYTTLDPGYVDPLNGDFTLTNQNLIDRNVGDPRWRQ